LKSKIVEIAERALGGFILVQCSSWGCSVGVQRIMNVTGWRTFGKAPTKMKLRTAMELGSSRNGMADVQRAADIPR
jgi:hypothetical protein